MATVEKIRRDIEKTKEKISEQQKRLRHSGGPARRGGEPGDRPHGQGGKRCDNRELTAFLKAYASGLITPAGGHDGGGGVGSPRRGTRWRTTEYEE